MPKKPHVAALREAIASKLAIKSSRIYAMAKDLATAAQTKTEEGIYLLAARNGINLTKYLSPEKLKQIRDLLFQLKQSVQTVQPQTDGSKRKTVIKNVTVNISKDISLKNSLLPDKVLKEAKDMAEKVYPLLYFFENSAREVINRVMRHAHGDNWWDTDTKVSSDIRRTVKDRISKEDKNPWHGKRGVHPIYYTDLEHLGLIVKNNWPLFKNIFPDQEWFLQRIKEISHSRNPVAHMNPLSKADIERIKVYTREWEKQLAQKKGAIP